MRCISAYGTLRKSVTAFHARTQVPFGKKSEGFGEKYRMRTARYDAGIYHPIHAYATEVPILF